MFIPLLNSFYFERIEELSMHWIKCLKGSESIIKIRIINLSYEYKSAAKNS
jgi:hypothetical protein